MECGLKIENVNEIEQNWVIEGFFNSKYKDWKGEKINLKNKVMLVNLRLKRLNLKVEWNNVWMKEMIWKLDVLGLKKKNIVDKVLKMRKLLEVEMCVE